MSQLNIWEINHIIHKENVDAHLQIELTGEASCLLVENCQQMFLHSVHVLSSCSIFSSLI